METMETLDWLGANHPWGSPSEDVAFYNTYKSYISIYLASDFLIHGRSSMDLGWPPDETPLLRGYDGYGKRPE